MKEKIGKLFNSHLGNFLRIMNNTVEKKKCLFNGQIELLCLDAELSDEERKRTRLHLLQCDFCRKRFEELDLLYKKIEIEVTKPLSNKVLDLAKDICSNNTTYGLVLCEPLTRKNGKTAKPYRTRVVFTANGSKEKALQKLVDFDFSTVSEDSIAIRAMTDKECNYLLLFLWSNKNRNFGGWELDIPGESKKATFNPAGMSQIPLCNIEDLGEKVIYFEEKQNELASENRYKRIIEAISL